MTHSPAISAPVTPAVAQPLRSPSLQASNPKLKENVQKWVSQAFFGTLLKQMRESPFRTEMFDGGKGGQAFGSMYDQELAQRMSRGVGEKLVNSILRKIEGKAIYEKNAAAKKASVASSFKGVSNVSPAN